MAGPIERPDKLLPQLKADIRFKKENVVPGLSRMIIGYFKKTAVADTIAVYVESVYQNPDGQNGLSVLIATLLFSVQIYCDFSGYSDIAVGTSRLMGIRLMENFTQPYFSDSIRTFWDRWHRSLSEWLKDYLYFPLGGSRCSKLKTQRNILIVFLASGLWHGANFTFIIWGALHGIARVIENLVYPQRKKMEEKMNPAVRIIWGGICRVLTFLYVSFAWIFFRADSVSDAMTMTGKLFTDFSVTSKTLSAAIELLQLTPASTILAVGLIALLFLYDLGVRRHREEDILLDGSVEEGTISLRLITLFWIVIAAALMQIAAGGASTFLYFQF